MPSFLFPLLAHLTLPFSCLGNSFIPPCFLFFRFLTFSPHARFPTLRVLCSRFSRCHSCFSTFSRVVFTVIFFFQIRLRSVRLYTKEGIWKTMIFHFKRKTMIYDRCVSRFRFFLIGHSLLCSTVEGSDYLGGISIANFKLCADT